MKSRRIFKILPIAVNIGANKLPANVLMCAVRVWFGMCNVQLRVCLLGMCPHMRAHFFWSEWSPRFFFSSEAVKVVPCIGAL